MKIRYSVHKGVRYRLHVDITGAIVAAEKNTSGHPGFDEPIPVSQVPLQAKADYDLTSEQAETIQALLDESSDISGSHS